MKVKKKIQVTIELEVDGSVFSGDAHARINGYVDAIGSCVERAALRITQKNFTSIYPRSVCTQYEVLPDEG